MATEVDQSAIQFNTGLGYYGDANMFRAQLESFESMTLEPCVDEIHNAWMTNNLETVEREARKLKGGCS